MRLSIWVPGKPMGAPRPRSRVAFKNSVSSGPDGNPVVTKIPVPVVYKSQRDKLWLRSVEVVAGMGLNRPREMIDGPVRFTMVTLLPRPQALMRRKDPDGVALAPTNPNDCDNLLKGPMDILTRLGYWKDDRQVCDSRVVKCFHAKNGNPGALFIIEELQGVPHDLLREVPGTFVADTAQLALLARGADGAGESLDGED